MNNWNIMIIVYIKAADWGNIFLVAVYSNLTWALPGTESDGFKRHERHSIRSPRQRSWEVERPQCPRAAGGAICSWVDTCSQRMFLYRAFLDNLWTSLDDLVHFQTLWMKMIMMIQLDYWTLLGHIRAYWGIRLLDAIGPYLSTQCQDILRRRLVCKRMDC